jgi:phenylacetate-CoA ligase
VKFSERSWYCRSPIFIQNAAVSAFGAARRAIRNGRAFRSALDELLKSQWYSAGELEELQREKLSLLIRHCYERVPYYRSLMKELGLTPQDVRSPADLAKLPYLTKETLRTRADEFIAEGLRKSSLYVGETSGTTGTPLTLYRDKDNVILEQASIWRHWRIAGLDMWEPRATLRGDPVVPVAQMRPPYWRTNPAENQLIMSSFHLSRSTAKDFAAVLRDFGPRALQAYPSSVYFLAREMLDLGEKASIDYIFTGSEPVYPGQRETIEEVLEGRVFDFYGVAERVAFAMECPEHRGLHVAPEYGIVELADPLEPHAEGLYEIVGTGLNNLAMPLIRFRTGDLTTRLDTEPCPCGRNMPIIAAIETRAGDMIITPEGRHITYSGLTHSFMGLANIKRSQLVQETVDRLKVRVVPGATFSSTDRDKLIAGLRAYLGEAIRIDLELVEDIPREPSGKYRWVVSRVNPADWEQLSDQG